MNKFVEIYKRNIYGVMGTLLFHILLFSVFLLADVNIKGNVKEEELIIEFPDILPEPEPEKINEQNNKESTNETSINELTNIASNRMATENITSSAEDFFDNEYQEELQAARNLANDVNNQLSKKTVDLSDIEMPVESTEGMNPDSIKNIIYVGESNIVYYLENRHHVRLPVPIYLAQGGGKVIVDIVVNQDGKVVLATARDNNAMKDEQIFLYAEAAALNTSFNADENSPPRQKGTIHYTFVAQ